MWHPLCTYLLFTYHVIVGLLQPELVASPNSWSSLMAGLWVYPLRRGLEGLPVKVMDCCRFIRVVAGESTRVMAW